MEEWRCEQMPGWEQWEHAVINALTQSIEHLQVIIFDEGLDALVAEADTPEEGLRRAVARYEQSLTDLFAIVRVSGVLADAVAWSTLKANVRRAALDAGTEITLRTAIETGMYHAEAHPLGDHERFMAWSSVVQFLLLEYGRRAEPFPIDGDEESHLLWAYRALRQIEDHDAFHRAFLTALADSGDAEVPDGITAHQAHLLSLPRFDLLLNAGLLWLATVGGPWLATQAR